MKKPTPKQFLEIAVYLFILVLPAVVLFWLVPFASDTTIGNDYGIFPIQQQMELNYAQEKGTFPLYAPGFAQGRSQAALTMGQLFHPISHLARHTPGYWDGHALSINTLYKLIGLGLVHLILFVFLRRLSLGIGPSLFLSVITVYNLRMLDLFRYGASLENYTGYLLLCASVGFLFMEKNKIAAAVAVVISAFLLICGGHPQMMYLGLLGAGLFTMVLPFCAAAVRPDLTVQLQWKSLFRFWGTVGAALLLGMLLSSPYVLSFYVEFVADNALRVGREYQWSLAYQDTIGGALNSIFLPIHADVHGAFGSSPIIALAPLLLLSMAAGIRVPLGVAATSILCILIFLCSAGDATPIHYLFWKFVPLAQTFRVPGRITMLLPALLMLALAWLFAPVEKDNLFKKFTPPFNRLLLPAIGAIGLYLFYHSSLLAELPEPSRYTPSTIIGEKMRDAALLQELQTVAMPRAYWLGLVTLILSALYAVHLKWKSPIWKGLLATLMVAAVLTQVTTQLRYGTWQTEAQPRKTLEEMDVEKEKQLSFVGSPGFGMESPQVTEQMAKSILPTETSRFYRNVTTASNRENAYAKMQLHRNSKTAVVEVTNRKSIENGDEGTDRVELLFSSFNHVTFAVSAAANGVLTFNQPFDGRWRALVDDAEKKVYAANGIENAVFLSKGDHQVTFWYRSASVWVGALIAMLTALGIVAALFFIFLKGKKRFVAMGGAAIFFVGLFICWDASLYNGQNLNTQYSWNSNQQPNPKNLAFAKPTTMSSIRSNQMPYFYYSGFAVDGDHQGRGFATNPRAARPWWQVDLGTTKKIGKIKIHTPALLRRHLPLTVWVRTNASFHKAHTITRLAPGTVMEIDLNGTPARVIRLQSASRGAFSLKEVEIFEHTGPTKPVLNDQTDPTGNLRNSLPRARDH